MTATRFKPEYLDQLARNKARAFLEELLTHSDDILTDDDLCGAAEQAQAIFLEHTAWTLKQCRDRAWELAEPIYNSLKP